MFPEFVTFTALLQDAYGQASLERLVHLNRSQVYVIEPIINGSQNRYSHQLSDFRMLISSGTGNFTEYAFTTVEQRDAAVRLIMYGNSAEQSPMPAL